LFSKLAKPYPLCNSAQLLQMLPSTSRASINCVHEAFAWWVYMDGLPFKITKSKYLRDFLRELRKLPHGLEYTPPAYNTLRSTLLTSAKQRVDKQLELWESSATETGITICCDGCNDAANHQLLNVLAVTANGAKFVDAIDTEGQQKTAEYIAARLGEAIERVGPKNVVQVGAARGESQAGPESAAGLCGGRHTGAGLGTVGCWFTSHALQSMQDPNRPPSSYTASDFKRLAACAPCCVGGH
jgi:hypothetical protein